MIALGIEGTAHTVGVGIVQDQEPLLLANEMQMYRPVEGGIHPRDAANHHAAGLVDVIQDALDTAHLDIDDIDLVGFSMGPGLGPCLRTVATAARSLALHLDVPLLGVNHCIAHLEIGRAVTDADDPVLLYVSGGNTQVIAFLHGRYRVFGETLDIGIGNCLDKFGRQVDLKFPAGPRIEELARQGERYVELPYSVKGMDVSFSGILTAALSVLNDHALADVCYSLQETCFAMLTEVTERAMAHTAKDEVLLGGGVASNQRLQDMVTGMATAREASCYVPPRDLLVDNGAMIAWTALLMHQAGVSMDVASTEVQQKYRTDEVDVVWRN
ncbi:MAG: bifunctional N(6)-L-threonylcarbamoyladenine synthase/serine/threonine protein kinase [Thermoplasmatota archaeon]